jgi:2-succinyl-5-enolpyruvyl-6-hydroxy-3-cyclohexene-1-carboxylate synthase
MISSLPPWGRLPPCRGLFTRRPMTTGFLTTWRQCPRGMILAGPAQPQDPAAYCRAVAELSRHLGWPVLAEGLSPLRNYADGNPHLVSTYDAILRQPAWARELAPSR